MGLSDDLLRGVFSQGFEVPSPIQQRAIKPVMDGRDTLAQAQSGTGKTGAFSIGALGAINPDLQETQVLILEPTRELAGQTHDVITGIAQYMGIETHLSMGGTRMSDDGRAIERRPHVITGTPGRILDWLSRGTLDARLLKMLILDEADEVSDSCGCLSDCVIVCDCVCLRAS